MREHRPAARSGREQRALLAALIANAALLVIEAAGGLVGRRAEPEHARRVLAPGRRYGGLAHRDHSGSGDIARRAR